MWCEWRKYRNIFPGFEGIECDLDNITSATPDSPSFALCRFITEVKKLDDTDYPGKTVYGIVLCVQFHLEMHGISWKIIAEERFKDVKFTLDNLMKRRCEDTISQVEILSFKREDIMGEMGILGTQTPGQPVDTILFLLGINCAQ